MGIGGRMGAGASLRIGPSPAYQTDSGSPFPGVTDTSATLVGGPAPGAPVSALKQPATIIALGAVAYLFVVYVCWHHY